MTQVVPGKEQLGHIVVGARSATRSERRHYRGLAIGPREAEEHRRPAQAGVERGQFALQGGPLRRALSVIRILGVPSDVVEHMCQVEPRKARVVDGRGSHVVLERPTGRIAQLRFERAQQRQRRDRQGRCSCEQHQPDDPTAQTKDATPRSRTHHYEPLSRYPAPRTVRM